MSLRRLGLEKRALGQVKEVLQKGRGAVVIISPFNSGKTTTLYSLVEQVNRPDLNVTTFEHQIKVDMPNINQSQVSPGKNNVSLSSILKQDPDVVMIDELIDKDGVEAALHLAERGYFVLAGIYGTNLSSTLDFMQGLGVSLPLFVSSVKMVINQRLVFSNCPRCLVKEKVSKDVLAEIKKIFSRSGFFDELKNCRIIPVSAKSVDDLSFYKGAGCQFCKKTGLSGKTAVFEVLSVDDDVKKMIREGHFSSLKGQSAEQGNFTLSESAFMKAAAGIIPLSEVLKIIKEPGL
jgi:type IV pilus assembly protein PilB